MQGPSILSRWFLVTILSVLLIFFDRRVHYLDGFRSWVLTAVYPLQAVVDVPNTAYNWVDKKMSSRETLLQQNDGLEAENRLLQAKLLKLSALQVENDRLRELLKSSKKVGEQVLIGELLAVDLEPFTRQVVINKGSRDGVFLGQPLLDAHGVMGQVVHVGPFSSTGMLITDPSHAIPVQVNRNGLRAIVLGTGAPDVLEVPYLANSAEIQEGDLLVSSGLGGRFPPDYPVAKVVSVLKDPTKPYAVVTAEPTAKLERSREVLLVWRTQNGELQVTAPGSKSGAIAATATPTAVPKDAVSLDTPRDLAPLSSDTDTTVVQQPEPPTPVLPEVGPEEQKVESVAPNEAPAPQQAPAETAAPAQKKAPAAAKPQPAPKAPPAPALKVTAPKKIPPPPEPAPAAEKAGAAESKPKAPANPAKPADQGKKSALPLSEQAMPIEEDFVAPSGPTE